jgi:Kelch motif protein
MSRWPRNSWMVDVSCIATLAATLLAACATDSATEAWRPLREAPLERTEVGAARIGHSIYVVGGFVRPSTTTAVVERYDIGRDRWQLLPSMPIAVNHPAVASHRGFLYVYGGYTGSDFVAVTDALQRYDPRTGRWTLLPGAPTGRAAAGLVAYRGELFAVGGTNDDFGPMRRLEIYDIAKREWRRGPPMRVPREHVAAVATADGVYVLGGRLDGGNLDTAERFDPRRGRWSRLPHLLFPRSGFAAAAVGGKPVAFGGEELTPDGTTIAPVEIFDPARRRWRRLPDMRIPRHGLGGAALGRRVYALEGGPHPGFAFSAAIEFLDIPRDLAR